MDIDKSLIGKPPNVAVVINEQIIEKEESYKQEDEQEPLITIGEFDCLTCDAKVELCGEIDRLTTERDTWANCYDMAVKREKSLLSKIDSLTAECDLLKGVKNRLKRENDELKARNHELESAFERMDALLVQKQHVIDIQRESFKRLEYEITVLKKKGAM